MEENKNFLKRIEDFCLEYKIGKTQFGQMACNNANLITELRDGQSPTLRTVEKVLGFIRAYKLNKDREMKRFFVEQKQS